jgi:hypothetical protein
LPTTPPPRLAHGGPSVAFTRVDRPWHPSCVVRFREAGERTGPGAVHRKEVSVLWAIIAVLLILWLLGFTVVNVGSLIHLLLVIALVVLIAQLLTGRRAV